LVQGFDIGNLNGKYGHNGFDVLHMLAALVFFKWCKQTTGVEIEGNCFVVLKHLLVAGLFAMHIPQELMSYGQGFPW
jgi:hypothetical protein